MKQIICEMCGSNNLVKDGGVFVCQSCGCKYSVEEARKMMVEVDGTVEVTGTVKVDNSAAISNYLKMAQNAMEASNNQEAESYANKIIEIDPQHSEAWNIKGEAAGWQSTIAKPRLSDAVEAWLKAIQFAEEDKKFKLREEIAGNYTRLFIAMISLNAERFGEIQSEDNRKNTKTSVGNGLSMMNKLLSQGGVSFNRAYTYNKIARLINDGAVDGYKDAKEDFGPEHHNMSKWQWERFTGSCDECINMLKIALELVRDDSLGKTICNNLITIGEAARDSCSWKFNVNAWTADHYEKDFSFTEKAKEIRTKNINEWKEKRNTFSANKKDKVLKAVQGGRSDEEEARGRAKYWEEHADEKIALENEKAELETKNRDLNKQLDSLPILGKITETKNSISSLEQKKSSLGLFKGKEKKEIQEQIDQLKAVMSQQEKEAEDAKEPILDAIEENDDRIDEIKEEFTKSRGKISITEESFVIDGAIVDGKFAITPEQFVEHLKKLIPAPYYLEEKMDIAPSDLVGDRLGLGLQYQVAIKNSSKKTKDGDNDNSGFVVLFQADSPSDTIKSICLECSDAAKEDYAKLWCTFGADLLLLLCPDTSRSEAEFAICNMILDDESALYGFGDIRAEYASYTFNILGMLDCTRHVVVIRTQN